MKNATVFFADTSEQVLQALRYKNTYVYKDLKIIAFSLDALLTLEKNGISPNNYRQIMGTNPDFYAKDLKKVAKDVAQYVKTFKQAFDKIHIYDVSVYDTLSVNIESSIGQILFFVTFLQRIESQWHPKKYFFPKDVQTSSSYAHRQLSSVLRIYVPQEKIEFYDYIDPATYRIKIPNLPITYWLQQTCFWVLNKVHELFSVKKSITNKYLLFSAGMNLNFYHTVLKGRPDTFIVTGNQSPKDEYLLRTNGIEFTPIKSFIGKGFKQKRDNLYRLNIEKLNKIKKPNKYAGALVNFLFETTHHILFERLSKVIDQTILAKNVIESVRPKIVFTTHDPGPSAVPFVQLARARKLKTVVLLHGWNDSIIGQNYFSDEIVVWGKYMKHWYGKVLNKKLEKIHSKGFPYYDTLFRDKAFWLKKKSLTIKKNNLVLGVLITLYPIDSLLTDSFLFELFKSARQQRFNGQIWIRTHPGQFVPTLKKLASHFKIPLRYNMPNNLQDFLKGSDFVFSLDTSAIYWAMIYGKPLLYATPMWGKGITPVDTFGAGFIPRSAKHLFRYIQTFNKNKLEKMRDGQLKMLREVVGYQKKPASLRTKELLDRF